jgi:enoyl-CoA hydratase/carnithine racemase
MKTVRFECQGSIGRIVLANPPYNRLDLQFLHCLRDAVHEASSNDIRALVLSSEGEHFSFGGEVREWPGKDIDWFRTFIAEVNASYRALEVLRVPTVAAVKGAAFGGGFELALSCDFLVAADNAVFRCIEVTTGFIPIAGGLQRLAERVGRSRASRFAMLGEPISGALAGNLGIATHVVASSMVEDTAAELAATLANGPTNAYAAVRTLLKAWSAGGVPAADAVMLDITMPLHATEDVTRGFINTAKAFDKNVEPPAMIFHGRSVPMISHRRSVGCPEYRREAHVREAHLDARRHDKF